MGKKQFGQSKEKFIKSRQDARATEAKAAEAKQIQDQALARRNANRAILEQHRSTLRQRPVQRPVPTAEMQQQPANRNFQPMAKNVIGSAVGNQGIGGSGKPMVQPGLQDGGLLYNDNVRSLDDMASGMVPQMSSTPTTMQGVPYTEWPKKSQKPDMREDTQFLTGKGFNETFDPNKKEIPLVFSPEERKSQQAIAPVAYEDKYGGFGGSGKTADELKERTPPAPKAKSTDAKPSEKEDKAGDSMKALKSLADAMKPKEELPATQYRSFTVDDTSAPIKDVMSARREALMKIMGGK
jgi:hypothetical protein